MPLTDVVGYARHLRQLLRSGDATRRSSRTVPDGWVADGEIDPAAAATGAARNDDGPTLQTARSAPSDGAKSLNRAPPQSASVEERRGLTRHRSRRDHPSEPEALYWPSTTIVPQQASALTTSWPRSDPDSRWDPAAAEGSSCRLPCCSADWHGRRSRQFERRT